MRRSIPIGTLILAAVVTSGCASGLQQRLNEQQTTLEEMRTSLEELSQQAGAQGQETEAIKRDIQQIGTKVTQTEEQISGLNNRVENLNTRVTLLTEDVTRMKAGAAQPAQPAGGALRFTETPGAVSGNVQATYDSALRLYYDNRPREAIEAFSRVLEMDPSGDLADNAEYWTGECYYKLEELPQALAAFKRVFDHSFTDKYDDAQLKIGMTYRLMGERDNAIAAFQELLRKYPESPYAELARRYLKELGGGSR